MPFFRLNRFSPVYRTHDNETSKFAEILTSDVNHSLKDSEVQFSRINYYYSPLNLYPTKYSLSFLNCHIFLPVPRQTQSKPKDSKF